VSDSHTKPIVELPPPPLFKFCILYSKKKPNNQAMNILKEFSQLKRNMIQICHVKGLSGQGKKKAIAKKNNC
jgi:hypothetical protein